MTDCGPELSVASGAAAAVGPVVTASTVVTAAAMTQEDRKERRMLCVLPNSTALVHFGKSASTQWADPLATA
jgi:hypothetical protein